MVASREDIRDFLRRERDCVLVEVTGAAGSTPRDTDAWMLVAADSLLARSAAGNSNTWRLIMAGGRSNVAMRRRR